MYNIDELYNNNKIPDRYYNQLNGKTAQENYKRFKMKQKKESKGFIFSIIEQSLSAIMKSAFDEIFSNFKSQY